MRTLTFQEVSERSPKARGAMGTMRSEVYYDPYDVEIHADPYPAFRRLREEAPLR